VPFIGMKLPRILPLATILFLILDLFGVYTKILKALSFEAKKVKFQKLSTNFEEARRLILEEKIDLIYRLENKDLDPKVRFFSQFLGYF
jgi:hypothetical protein